MAAYRVSAVAYHPRVVTIWDAFERWFAAQGFPVETTLFTSYEQQVDGLLAGNVDVAWNTNLAYVQTRLRAGSECRAIAMRDTDRGWTSHLVVPAGSDASLEGLRGKRVGFGDSDSPQAWILPAHLLRRAGLDPERDLRAERLDLDVGKHGDTGRAERAQLERLRHGELEATLLADPTLQAVRAEGHGDGLEIAWTSAPYHHCCFTYLASSGAPHDRFGDLLRQMNPSDARICEAMQLEWVNRWVDFDEAGYVDLIEAVEAGARS